MSIDIKLRIHNIISKSTLLHGSELWIMNRKDQRQLEAAKIHSLRPPAGLTRRDKQRNVDISNKVSTDNRIDGIRNYQQNWPQHVKRIENKVLPKLSPQYQSHGKRDIGRTKRRWREHVAEHY
jgi:hypothetical protein